MDTLRFGWTEPVPLSSELAKPLRQISAWSIFPKAGIGYVTLWREDGTGLRIFSQMHDVAERVEVGALNFEIVKSEIESAVTNQLQILDLDSAFLGKTSISKLVIEESGTRAESGIMLEAANQKHILIVASGMPCSIVVDGVDFVQPDFGPEYPLVHYEISQV